VTADGGGQAHAEHDQTSTPGQPHGARAGPDDLEHLLVAVVLGREELLDRDPARRQVIRLGSDPGDDRGLLDVGDDAQHGPVGTTDQ